MEGSVSGLEPHPLGLHVDRLEVDDGDVDLLFGLLVATDRIFLEALALGVVGGRGGAGGVGFVTGGAGGQPQGAR